MDIEIAGPSSSSIHDSDDDNDSPLANSEYLTREEVMKRRARRLRRLAKCYRDHYWVLMEDLRRKHRDFLWKFGTDPFNREKGGGENGGGGDIVNKNGGGDVGGKLGLGFNGGGSSSFSRCKFPACPSKAMALTSYCLSHIMSDPNQVLYTRCQHAFKSAEDPILCGKPALKSIVPSMCPAHVKATELSVRRALKKGGVSGAASNKLATKFHLILTEYVKLIQTKRRAAISKRVDNGTTSVKYEL